jgi:hypothetical protein
MIILSQLEWPAEEAAVVCLSYYLGIHLNGMRKPTKNINQDSHVLDEF